MENKTNLKNIYSEIREILFKMIPEKWDSIYLYASIIENENHRENGEMFFFYYPKGIIKKNPVNVYEVPAKFNINEQEYMILATRLYEIIKLLRHECMQIDKEKWTNITISIENVEFLAQYNFDNLTDPTYTDADRRMIWKYKYLDYPIEKMNKEERNTLKKYLEEEEQGQHKTTMYSETFYQKHIHNDIQYDDEQIKENENRINISEENISEQSNQIKSQILKLNK